MDIFQGWENYTERIKENWLKNITPEDTVVLAGDTSWGMTLSESLKDFEFINAKGSHKGQPRLLGDYWSQNGGIFFVKRG